MKATYEAAARADLLRLHVASHVDLGAVYLTDGRWCYRPRTTRFARGEEPIVIAPGSKLTVEISAPEDGGPALVRVARSDS